MNEGFLQGNVYHLDDITQKYNHILANKHGKETSIRSHKLKEKLSGHYGEGISFRRQRNPNLPLLVFPVSYDDSAVEALKLATDTIKDIPGGRNSSGCKEQAGTNLYQSLYHVACRIKSDINQTPGHDGYRNLNINAAEKCVPDSLYLLLKWILIGDSEGDFDNLASEDSAPTENATKEKAHLQILNIAQSIVYAASNGRKHTPKHIGAGILIHHVTRSKQLIEFFHAAGESIGYDTVLRIDTSLALEMVEKFKANGNIFVPSELVSDRFVHFAGDNLDIIEETLDGKGTFHVTSMAAFQRGPKQVNQQTGSKISRKKALGSVPEELNKIITVEIPAKHALPSFSIPVKEEWFISQQSSTSDYHKMDLAWVMSRMQVKDDQCIPSWTGFNQVVSKIEPDVSIVGLLPIIPAVAHEMDTLMTVLLKCKDLSKKLNQVTTVVTFDQALYCRARELVWYFPQDLSNVIIRLGGFHTALNYLSAMGKHLACSGLTDVWIESGMFSECTAEKIMQGKSWNRALHAHKLTMEAFWRLLLEKFFEWQDHEGIDTYISLCQSASDIAAQFKQKATTQEDVQDALERFVAGTDTFYLELHAFLEMNSHNATFKFWKD